MTLRELLREADDYIDALDLNEDAKVRACMHIDCIRDLCYKAKNYDKGE